MSSIEEVRPDQDHVAGQAQSNHHLIEYGSYACSHCRAAHQIIAKVQVQFESDMAYVFRHKPLRSDPMAIPSAILAEFAAEKGRFWEAHALLMEGPIKAHADLVQIASILGISREEFEQALTREDLKEKIVASEEELKQASIQTTPAFFINGHKYEGAWDEMSLIEALDAPVAHQLDRVAREFAGWAPATGVVLAICAAISLLVANSEAADWMHSLLELPLGVQFGGWQYAMPLHAVINDLLMSVFFLVVGLEIKREMTIGELSNVKVASLPIAAALGGMLVPAALYLLITMGSTETSGWGIPMATDIAFALGLLALLGRRVPTSLKVFLTALAIVDDLGAIIVIALFYGHGFETTYAVLSVLVLASLIGINLAGVYHPLPYVILGILLWVCVYASGLHATLAGILLAMAIPTRPPPNLQGLMAQARAIIQPQLEKVAPGSKQFPEHAMLRELDAIHDRIESPAHRIERLLEPWSSFFILPIFALANAGVSLAAVDAGSALSLAIVVGLVLGKPLGVTLASWLLVRSGFASLPSGVSWPMVIAVGFLAGIGFTMSIFISNEAFTDIALVQSAKVAVLAASVIAAISGLLLLRKSLPDVSGKTES